MYDFHYNYIQGRYGCDRARLLFTDTDNLCYKIQTDDVYEDMARNLQHYDTSAYPKTHFLYNPVNAKVKKCIRNETNSIPPEEFVGLRAKMYSLQCSYAKMTAKGIKNSYIKRHVRHSAFVDALRGKQQSSTARFKTFRSTNHAASTVDIEKICLSPFDSKRYFLPDGISTLAYGHFRLRDM